MKYTQAKVICYCGRKHIIGNGRSKRCSCGIMLHVSKGRAWGTAKNKKHYEFAMEAYKNGAWIDAQWIAQEAT